MTRPKRGRLHLVKLFFCEGTAHVFDWSVAGGRVTPVGPRRGGWGAWRGGHAAPSSARGLVRGGHAQAEVAKASDAHAQAMRSGIRRAQRLMVEDEWSINPVSIRCHRI